MAIPFSAEKRQVVPRLRTTKSLLAIRELVLSDQLSGDKQEKNAELLRRISDWQINRSLHFATDLVGTAFALNSSVDEAVEAARFVLDSDSTSHTARTLATRFLALGREDELSSQVAIQTYDHLEYTNDIHVLRNRLKRFPNNAIAWGDLAFAHASVGSMESALRCGRVALALAPNNQFLLRSVSRLYTHADEPDHAVNILRGADDINSNPWLIAAEIAISDRFGIPSRFITRGRRLIKTGDFSAFHLSELASSVATLELENGNFKKARKLFRKSLEDPTENSVAQAEWVSTRLEAFDIEEIDLEQPCMFEARSYYHFYKEMWEEALLESSNWLHDQPFSAAAAIHSSYIAAVGLEDYDSAIMRAKFGLRANPGDYRLMNNLIFSLINKGDIIEAESIFAKIRMKPNNIDYPPSLLATLGLLHFRKSQIDQGRHYYSRAVDEFVHKKKSYSETLAMLFWAREELHANTAESTDIFERAAVLAKENDRSDIKKLMSTIKK